MFLTDPLFSLPNLLIILGTFYNLSGLGVNPSKCIAMPINIPQPLLTTIKDRFGFSCSTGTLQYLRIRLAPSLKLMNTHNYPQAFSNIKWLLTQWSSYQISFLGRIQAVKMSILPKMLFYFRSLPLYVSRSTIEAIQAKLLRLILQNKELCLGCLLMYRAHAREAWVVQTSGNTLW